MREEFQLKLLPITKGLRAYHRHEVYGLDHFPAKGPVIVACTHSLATYDITLLMSAIYQEFHRFPRALIDHAFYKFPGLGELMEGLGCILGHPDNAKTLLKNGELLYIAPGGMRESLRPSSERYQIRWNRRKGFARLAIETGSPVVLAACPRADDIYTVYDSKATKWIYKQFRLPFFVAHGIGPTAIPKPVKLAHYLSKPIYPPRAKKDPAAFKRQVYQFHRRLIKHMNEMISEGLVATEDSIL
jgi:1-acyl-sn-glycerol-3-phosphate acyltransferase